MSRNNGKNSISKQVNKEVLITIMLYLLYFVWWYYFAYEYSSDNVEEYKYILGLPEWFFYSCVLGLIFINILVYVCIKFFFKDVDFEKYNENNDSDQK
ncbi:YhdT family protein [Fusobacterium simiae]|uniref:YhdT family protein n=1 Tax=Fusobacterium simiae TaxID=855 RepID=A0ABT4DIW6_FUSSI|nr:MULTISPECIES: YhdT family protein [Fusobacterium]MCY7007219.1 YhdT family protein [Fusobacterium simiae]MDC7956176.1 YhdT family protein [Fusobacterium simiae]